MHYAIHYVFQTHMLTKISKQTIKPNKFRQPRFFSENLRNQSLQLEWVGLQIVEMEPTIQMHQFEGDFVQVSHLPLSGNPCLFQMYMSDLLQC